MLRRSAIEGWGGGAAGWLIFGCVGCAAEAPGEQSPYQHPHYGGCTRQTLYFDDAYPGEVPFRRERYDAQERLVWSQLAYPQSRGLPGGPAGVERWAYDTRGCLVEEGYDDVGSVGAPWSSRTTWDCDARGLPEWGHEELRYAGVLLREQDIDREVLSEGDRELFSATWYLGDDSWTTVVRQWAGERQIRSTWTRDGEASWAYIYVTMARPRVDWIVGVNGAEHSADRTQRDEHGRWIEWRRWEVREEDETWYRSQYTWSEEQYTLLSVVSDTSYAGGPWTYDYDCTLGWPWSCDVHLTGPDGLLRSSWTRSTWSCDGDDLPGEVSQTLD